MSAEDSYLRLQDLGGMLSLSGPSPAITRDRLPVRGDLAHIRLAGKCFVPHYAVPMPHRAKAGARLLRTDQPSGEVVATLAAGTAFDVLDIAGGWAWGQVADQAAGEPDDEGAVGYVALAELIPLA